jgi:hypothetical protein
VAICAGTPLSLISATDPDKDVLVYNLCSANNGGGQGNQSNGCTNCPAPIVASVPPYSPLPYNGSYSGGSPMGASVTMNSQTGILSGIAPSTVGQYVVTACIGISQWQTN